MESRRFGQPEVQRQEPLQQQLSDVVNAAGCYAPPMVTHKMATACEDLKRGAPPGLFLLSTQRAVLTARNIISTKNNILLHV
jgi:hypothetical protein